MAAAIETEARLEWWANSVTCLGSVAVHVFMSDTEDGWRAEAALEPELDDEGFEFLLELDPRFTLRFPDDSHIDVIVKRSSPGRLILDPRETYDG